jgi:hypothetical protein
VTCFKVLNYFKVISKLLGIESSHHIMVKELLQGTTKWFKAKMGLCDQGLDIRREIKNAHASLEDYEAMFGKRKGFNGFRYDVCKDSTLVARV